VKRFLLLAGCLGVRASATASATVILLHGLGRTRWSMSPLATALARDGTFAHRAP